MLNASNLLDIISIPSFNKAFGKIYLLLTKQNQRYIHALFNLTFSKFAFLRKIKFILLYIISIFIIFSFFIDINVI